MSRNRVQNSPALRSHGLWAQAPQMLCRTQMLCPWGQLALRSGCSLCPQPSPSSPAEDSTWGLLPTLPPSKPDPCPDASDGPVWATFLASGIAGKWTSGSCLGNRISECANCFKYRSVRTCRVLGQRFIIPSTQNLDSAGKLPLDEMAVWGAYMPTLGVVNGWVA